MVEVVAAEIGRLFCACNSVHDMLDGLVYTCRLLEKFTKIVKFSLT